MSQGRTLGVLGTLVWDHIVPWEPDAAEVEDWGGIAYALVAAAEALPDEWTILPIIKLGADRQKDARRFVSGLSRVDPSGLFVAPEANNKVELRYHSEAERTEVLTGGVPGWTVDELSGVAGRCDALLVNFISGFELSLEVAAHLRSRFRGPIYADLHSLFLGVGEDGTRLPKSLHHWLLWAACFDVVQMNEEEFSRRGVDDRDDPVLRALGAATKAVAVTLGDRGAALYGELPPNANALDRWSSDEGPGPDGRPEPRCVTLDRPPVVGDPTGCGDVWGAAMFSRLLAGDALQTAAAAANDLAALNAEVRGVGALRERLSHDTRNRLLRPEGLNTEEGL